MVAVGNHRILGNPCSVAVHNRRVVGRILVAGTVDYEAVAVGHHIVVGSQSLELVGIQERKVGVACTKDIHQEGRSIQVVA